MEAFRTPEERFADLPEFPWEPRYLDWDGLRLARIDEGGGQPVVLFHGGPTWSYLWRKVMPPLLAAGHRCIALDLPGFGRSDKPIDFDWYSYDRHVEATVHHLDERLPAHASDRPEDVGAEAGERTAEAVAAHDRPSLCLWADSDPILSVATGRAVGERLRLPEPEVISGASHFLQEDQGT